MIEGREGDYRDLNPALLDSEDRGFTLLSGGIPL
jgi:hypothetical protein